MLWYPTICSDDKCVLHTVLHTFPVQYAVGVVAVGQQEHSSASSVSLVMATCPVFFHCSGYVPLAVSIVLTVNGLGGETCVVGDRRLVFMPRLGGMPIVGIM